MRGILIAILFALITCACNGFRKQDAPPEAAAVVHEEGYDSLSDSDASADVAPPSSADEFFDDFIFSFMSNRDYQFSRITFPLPYTNEGRTTLITQDRWRFDSIYANEDFFVAIFDNMASMKLEKDTNVNSVNVTWLYLKYGKTKNYDFERVNGRWNLVKLDVNAVGQNEDADFLQFYTKFSADDDYQNKHLAEKIVFKSYDYENSQDVSGYVEADQWESFRPYIPSDAFVSVNYGQTAGKGDTRYFVIRGISNSMMNVLRFEKRAKMWQLVEFEN